MESLQTNDRHVISILEDIKGKSIKKIEIEEEKKFETITEYDFKISKVKMLYKDGKEEEIFLKVIKGGKIKESIFCYWSILYEEYLKENTQSEENIVHKAIITQVTSDEKSSSIILTINAKLDYCVEIDLIELKEYYKKYKEIRREDSTDINEDEILFIGKKMY